MHGNVSHAVYILNAFGLEITNVVIIFTFTALRALLFTASGKTPAERFYSSKKGLKKIPGITRFSIF
jgi:hypothetical protein